MSDPAASPTQIKPDDQRPEHPDFWSKRFGEGVTPWDAGKVPAAFAEFAARQPAALDTLIPGCGSAWEAAHLADIGWPVTALDFSPVAIEKAREILASAPVDLVCAVIAPDDPGAALLQAVSAFSKVLRDAARVAQLRAAPDVAAARVVLLAASGS